MKRLVFVNYPLETFTPTASGALATYIWELCRAAARDGVEPLVITRAAAQPFFDWPHVETVDPGPAPSGLGRQRARALRRTGWVRHLEEPAYLAAVTDAVARAGAAGDILLLQNSPELAVALRRRFPRARIVHLFQNQLEGRPRVRVALAGAVDLVAAVSGFTAGWVSQHYGLSSVRVIHSGVDADVFSPGSPPAGPPVINFTGRTGIEKAPDLLYEAADRLASEGLRFEIQICGSNHWDHFEMDAYQARLAELAGRLEARGVAVHRLGHVARPDLPAAMRRAAVHVTPSRWDEPFGLSTLEGMATGLATIASRTGGTPEVVGDAGLMFERDDVAGLAERLREVIGDPRRREQLGRLARARALRLSWRRTWEDWRDALDRL